jgi:hypothetical protein
MTRTPGLNAERLRRVLAAQHDLISSAQAHACGLTRKALAYRLRREGPWQRLLPGVYLAINGAVTQQQREMAALLYAGPRGVITGPVAVRRHGLTSAGPNVVDVLVPISVRRQNAGFVRLHRTARMPQRYFAAGQIRFAKPARAVTDAARSFTRFDDVRAVVCQAVQRGKCTVHELTEELHAGPSAGSALLREALAEIGDGVRSVAEAEFRRLILNSGLPKPMFNAQLFDARGKFIAMVDAWWQRAGVAAEVDSRAYHLSAADQDRTTERHNMLLATHDIRPLHFPPARIHTDGSGVLDEIGQAIEKGLARPPLPIAAYPLAA